jgi:hypothetical protein
MVAMTVQNTVASIATSQLIKTQKVAFKKEFA